MKPAAWIPALLVLGLAACRPPQAIPADTLQTEVRAAVDRFSQASGKADLAAVLAQFDDQADILLVGSDKGEVFRGRPAIQAWLGNLYKYSGFSWEFSRVEISGQGATAWVFTEGRAVVTNRATGALRFSAPYRFSAVLVRREDGWKWRLFHGSTPAKE